MPTEKKTIDQWRAMAQDYMDKHGCRWSEACLHIKQQYPESRAAFGAPPKMAAS